MNKDSLLKEQQTFQNVLIQVEYSYSIDKVWFGRTIQSEDIRNQYVSSVFFLEYVNLCGLVNHFQQLLNVLLVCD